jgi:phage baseplate assembly protein V
MMNEHIINKLFSRLLQVGTIAEIQADPLRYKVKYDDARSSYWLIQLTDHASTEKSWSPLNVGEQVLVFQGIGNTQGYILGSINQTSAPQSQTDLDVFYRAFSDGTKIKFNRKTKALDFHCMGKVTGTAIGGFELTGDLKITGDVTLIGKLTQTGDQNITGKIESTGDQTANGISLINHPHDKVTPGTGVTGKPQ